LRKELAETLLIDLKASQGLEKNISGKVLVKSNIDLNPIAYQCALQNQFLFFSNSKHP
jgi:hypothetical protein